MYIGIPQFIVIVFLILNFLAGWGQHNRTGTYNGIFDVVLSSVVAACLYWGGFFSGGQ